MQKWHSLASGFWFTLIPAASQCTDSRPSSAEHEPLAPSIWVSASVSLPPPHSSRWLFGAPPHIRTPSNLHAWMLRKILRCVEKKEREKKRVAGGGHTSWLWVLWFCILFKREGQAANQRSAFMCLARSHRDAGTHVGRNRCQHSCRLFYYLV